MTNLSMPRCDIEELKGQIEQLKALNTADDYLIKLLEEQNQQLKELLKECREIIETSVWGNCSELTDQIDEVIGEKKCR